MKFKRGRSILPELSIAVVAVLATAVVSGAGRARQVTLGGPQTTVVGLRLSVSGRIATIKVPDKGCGSVTVEGQPAIRFYVESVRDGVRLAAWEVAGDSEACLPAETALRAKLVAKGPMEIAIGEVKLQFELLALSTIPAAQTGLGPCRTCCVACEGMTTCACEVETVCGRCCCPDACGCQPAAVVQGIR